MRTPLVLLFAIGVACSGPKTGNRDWADGACLVHADCDHDLVCVLGTCAAGSLDEPVDVAPILASQWFVDPDGACSYDDECGPWMCSHGRCVTPQEAERSMLWRGEYRYWDTSCLSDEDCGSWGCVRGWCTEPGYGDPYAAGDPIEGYGYGYGSAGGHSCLGDSECPEDADCMYPGTCVSGTAAEEMTFAELDDPNWYANYDGHCSRDTDCGPLACDSGWCTPHEFIGRSRPLRRELFYYDASCSTDDQCGPWVCVGGWCNDPAHI